jgi:hypothetical protein
MNLRDSLPRFLGNPIFGLLVSLASIVLAIFLYFQSQQTRDLVFTVHPARTIIARAGRPSELKVEFKGELIKADVIGAQLALWNQGKGSVHAGDVLSPIEIRLIPATPVLEVVVAKMSRSVVAIALDTDSEKLRQGRIPVSFKILEQGDGAIIQIIYAGLVDVEVSVVGIVEGAGTPRKLRATSDTSRGKRSVSSRERFFLTLLPSLIAGILVGVASYSLLRQLRVGPRGNILLFVLTCSIVIIGLSLPVAGWFFLPSIPTPPFGF